ncbi:MAG: hemerythrin domain-containing protein [Burkholderiaceae bacterium]|nr:hemerythrin domain-containing protein [Burkholderiaceae bacterium]
MGADTASGISGDNPLQDFSTAHAGILQHIGQLEALPAKLAAGAPDKPLQREIAALVAFFNDEMYEHHEQEERELFFELARAAEAGDELEMVRSVCARLVREHRQVERAWAGIEAGLKRLARGKDADLDPAAIKKFAADYGSHARFEETMVLPLSAKILRDGDKAALAVKLHLRHSLGKLAAYV